MTSATASSQPPAASRLPANLQQKMHRAVALQRSGRSVEALAAYRDIVAEAPEFPDALHFGALAAHATGDERLAREWLAAAERLAPRRVGFLLNAARVFEELGALEEAETRAERARRLAPQDPRALVGHANVLIKLDRGDRVLGELETLAKALPGEPHIGLLLARACLQCGRREQAADAFAKVCRGPGDSAAARLEYARFLREENELETARRHYERAARIGRAQERATAERGLASLAAQTGDKEEARRRAERALGASADMHHAWPILVDAGDEPELAALRPRMEKAREKTHSPEAFVLDFALGNLYERLGDYPAAWQAWRRGNRIRRRGLAYDGARESRFLADVRRRTGLAFLARHAEAGEPSRLPVFIVGLPRCGSTLLERALGGHPAVCEGGEMHAITAILRRRAGPEERHRIAAWLARRSSVDIGEIAAEWLAVLNAVGGGARRVTDKQLTNFALIGLIRACFPNATIVHMKRDPRDVFVSCWSTPFDDGYGYCYDAAEFKAYYADYRATMSHWTEILGKKAIIEVEYETLVANFAETIAGVLDAIGLEWHPDCARFAARPGNVHTASWFQVRRPLYSSSVGRWQHYRAELGSFADLAAWQ